MHVKQVEVHSGDIDALGHASNISFVRWIQEVAIEHSEAQVRLLVPHGDASAEISVVTPDRPRSATIRFGSVAEGRRRAWLAALDLLRRALA